MEGFRRGSGGDLLGICLCHQRLEYNPVQGAWLAIESARQAEEEAAARVEAQKRAGSGAGAGSSEQIE
eukprot:COSAG02_NODE_1147_length_14223_cov_4.760337_6_plen_68_part_00